jgi:DNA modification methylase
VTSETFLNGRVVLHCGDSRDVLKTIPDCSIDSIVTDPPYALVSIVKRFGNTKESDNTKTSERVRGRVDGYARLAAGGFMGKQWDTGETVESVEFWAECLRVLKPGGHLAAFSGTRTQHRQVCAIEDAGFEIRDTILELLASDTRTMAFMESLNDEQRGAFVRCLDENSAGGIVSWLYGSGFPKSHDVSKGIDKSAPRAGMFDAFAKHFASQRAAIGVSQKAIAVRFPSKTGGLTGCVWNWENGANVPTVAQWHILQPWLGLADEWLPLIEREESERAIVGEKSSGLSAGSGTTVGKFTDSSNERGLIDITAPATPAAQQWEGWGSALKPANEPICLARKPLEKGLSIAANVLKWGTGAINIGACRVNPGEHVPGGGGLKGGAASRNEGWQRPAHLTNEATESHSLGRWPANLLHDGSDEVIAAFPETNAKGEPRFFQDDVAGSAARFFYSAKADQDDRLGSKHPTVKPVDLIQYLCRLVTPKTTFEFVCETCYKPCHATEKETAPPVPGLRKASEPLPGDLLLPGVQREGANRESPSSQDMQNMSEEFPAKPRRKPSADVLRSCVRSEGKRIETQKTANKDGARILSGLETRTSDGEQARLRHGAQDHNGGALGSDASQNRGCSPPEWQADGQPNKEFGPDVKKGSRPTAEAQEMADSDLPALQARDKGSSRLVTAAHQKNCANCGSILRRVERRGVVLDMFAGTGTTGEAAFREGFSAVLIEREVEYCNDIRRRMALCMAGPDERGRESIKAKNYPIDHGPLFAEVSE